MVVVRRLVECECIDPARLIYRLPEGDVEMVFDRNVVLTDDLPIDPIDKRIQLRREPVGPVRCLMKQSVR